MDRWSLSCSSCIGRMFLVLAAAAFLPNATRGTAAQPDGFPTPAAGTFDDFSDLKGYPTAEELQKLLVRTPGEPYEIAEARKNDRPIRRASGLVRLGPAWPAGHALRLSILEPNALQLHLYSGQRGLSFRYYPEFHQTWAVYATTREPGKPRPAGHVFLGTTGDLYRRAGLGTFELHHHGGTLFMVRGDLVLAGAPLETPPSEVYLEGSALVRGIEFVPTTWTPPALPQTPAVWRSRRPADLSWVGKPVEGVALNRLDDGAVELAAGEKATSGQFGVLLEKPAPFDFVFEIENAEPGTGVFLGDAEGRHLVRLAFVRHRESGKTAFDLVPNWANEVEKPYDANRLPVPFSGARQWIRVVYGANVAKAWTSGDGQRWLPVAPGWFGADGACTMVGLYCLPANAKRTIRLRAMEARTLDALAAMSLDAARPCGPALAKTTSLAAWREQVIKQQPSDVPWERWWRACAVQTLVESPKGNLAQPLLDKLLQAAFDEPGDLGNRLALLDQAALLYRPDEWNAIDRFGGLVERLGQTLIRQGHPAPLSVLSRALLHSPLWHVRRLPVFSEAWLRQELFVLAGSERWEDLRAFVGRLRYWGGGVLREGEPLWGPPFEYLVHWADALADPHLPRRDDRKPRSPHVARHPYLEPSNKEAFNTVAEFRAAIDGQSYREACQLIAAIADPASLGLLGDRKDPHLLVTFPLAVELAMREYPALRQTMQEKYSSVGKLRIKQAAGSGNAAAIETVALQFPGTDAAAEAHRWLGDRALSAGRFVEALDHYRKALESAPAAERGPLGARCRLAGAMMGLDVGQPVTAGVQLGSTWLSAADFEQMVRQAREANRAGSTGQSPGAGPGLLPGRYEARPWSNVEGQDVRRPAGLPERGIDWAGLQTSVVVTGRQMLVANRIELMALNLENGQRQWLRRVPVREDRQLWGLVPMAPVVAGNRIFVRRLSNDGPELACLEAADGKVLWNVRPDGYVASDPLFVGSNLLVLSAAHDGADRVSLALVALRPSSGRTRSRNPLAEFRDVWNRQFPCQAVAVDGRIVAVAGACVLACDAAGRVQWVRRQIWVPPPVHDYAAARAWFDHVPQPPLVADALVYATQPGVFGVECLDLETGRLVWRKPISTMTRVVGLAAGRLVIQTTDGLIGLDARQGSVSWTARTGECLDVRLCGPSGPIVLVAPAKPEAKPGGPLVFTWIEAEKGRPLGTTEVSLPPVSQGPPQRWLKPLVIAGGRQWAFVGTGQSAAQRDVFELLRTGDLDTAPPEPALP
ncbi:MAG: PQQ-binding-like beta-propeller repeat protein [Thermoguttaceae bacterium]|jgi:outer membrane protein assembly factor BamB/tetratricopeptide (TPR) repeat protein|nr:PQQ-binding-like beta-propeller repeat protein [Thermoguttaceae bacterium]